jgi:hypothetical protein
LCLSASRRNDVDCCSMLRCTYSIRQHTSAYVSMRRGGTTSTAAACCAARIASVSIRQHTSACVEEERRRLLQHVGLQV